MEQITIDEFKKVEIRVGEILSIEKVEGADKLLRLMVSFGPKPLPIIEEGSELAVPDVVVVNEVELEVRQIISGIAGYFLDPQVLVGVKCSFVTNLMPRTIRGLESNGMILAATDDASGAFSLLTAVATLPAGSKAR